MKKLGLILLSLLLVSASPELKAESSGTALLRAFRCEGLGSETAAVRRSIGNLKDAINSIGASSGPCNGVQRSIAHLPQVDDLLSRLEDDSQLTRLRELEATVNEAMANLDYIKNVPDSERHLYPDESTLQNIIVTSRSDLLYLRAGLSISESQLSEQNRIRGYSELDRLGQRLADAIADHPECFEENSEMRRHSLTALVGISGYFMNEPVGIATTAAARNLQNLFRIFGSSRGRLLRSVQPIVKAELGLGFGCAIENLSSQHCNLIRQKKLLGRLSETEAGQCTNCVEDAMVVSSMTKRNLSNISDWIALRDRVGDSTNETIRKARSEARQFVSDQINGMLESITDTLTSVRSINSDVQRQKLITQKMNEILAKADGLLFGQMVRYSDGYIERGQMVSNLGQVQLQGNLTEEESYSFGLQLIFGDRENGRNFHRQLADEMARIQTRESVSGQNVDPNYRQSGSELLKDLRRFSSSSANSSFEKQFGNIETLEAVGSRLKAFRTETLNRLQTSASDQRKRDLVIEFFSGYGSEQHQSTFDSLGDLYSFVGYARRYLEGTPEGQFNDLDSLQQRIEKVIATANLVRSQDQPSIKEIEILNQEFSNLLGSNLEFMAEISTLSAAVNNVETRRLSEAGSEALFFRSQDVVRDAMNISSDADLFSRTQDVNAAMDLSQRQIGAFSSFFDRQTSEIKMLLNPENEESLSEFNRNQLCFQILGLKDPKKFQRDCKGTKITAPDGRTREFDDLVSKPLEERACALPLFRDSMKSR